VDAGTGLTAQALILALGCLGRYPLCEVLLCAGTAEEFTQDLSQRRIELEQLLLTAIKPAPFHCHLPTTAKSFGSTNQAVFQEIARTAQESGVLLDPIYSAKLFMKAREILPTLPAAATLLLIHSGGVQSLFGFPTQLQALAP
jgi:1-aminocyclopropane-1-carboxylate deaminase